jgi:hypothetical protein
MEIRVIDSGRMTLAMTGLGKGCRSGWGDSGD